jgi:alanine racemase
VTQASSWCRIHLDRVSGNIERALALVPEGRAFCAVLKADAYGHGTDRVVPLVMEQGVNSVGITSNSEAQAVRNAGFTGRLLRLRAATPAEIEDATEFAVEEQVCAPEAAVGLRAMFDRGRLRAPVHLALNSGGMARDSVELKTKAGRQSCAAILETLRGRIGGISTHFASNADPDLAHADARFQNDVGWVLDHSDLNRAHILVHAGSSLTLVSETPVRTDMYRCGAVLYGILKPDWGFCPTMDVEARIVSLQDYPAGSCVGYDHAARLDRDSRLACISIGYQNGFSRVAAGRSAVAIDGSLAPVIGKVSMNTIIADVSAIPSAAVGDAATVFGGKGAASIRPPDAERQFGTIMADLYTDWGMSNDRVYCRDAARR